MDVRIQVNLKAYSYLKLQNHFSLNSIVRDSPGGPVVKNPPCNAGNVGLIPGQGMKIP